MIWGEKPTIFGNIQMLYMVYDYIHKFLEKLWMDPQKITKHIKGKEVQMMDV